MQNILVAEWDLDKLDPAEQARLEEPLDLPHDPLVLSWGRYHREQQNQSPIDPRHLLPTPQDIQQAQCCGQYYRDKIMLIMLQGRRLTDFQIDLYAMLTKGARRKHEGMLYRLPYFYTEDQQRAQLQYQFRAPDPAQMAELTNGAQQLELTPVQIIDLYRRRAQLRQYWWRDQRGWAVKWTVDMKNPLFSLVRGLWTIGRPIRVEALIKWRLRDNLHHMELYQTQLSLAR